MTTLETSAEERKALRDLCEMDPQHSVTTTKLLRDFDRLLSLLQGWQPIETAPRDSKARLVWCPERQNTYIVTWHSERGNWVHFGGRFCELNEAPTMWMPLPNPPTQEGGGSDRARPSHTGTEIRPGADTTQPRPSDQAGGAAIRPALLNARQTLSREEAARRVAEMNKAYLDSMLEAARASGIQEGLERAAKIVLERPGGEIGRELAAAIRASGDGR